MRTGCVGLAVSSLLLFACSSSSKNDPTTGGGTGGGGTGGVAGSAGATGGADAGEKRCNPLAPFEQEHAIDELNGGVVGYGDTDARFSRDESIVFFASNRSNKLDLFTAKRSGIEGQFSSPVHLDNIAFAGGAFAPSVTGDLLDVFFAANFFADERIFRGHRSSEVNAFDSGSEVLELNKPDFSTRSPYVLPDGNVMYMISNRAGPSSGVEYFDIYRSERSGSTWKTPEPVANINESGISEASPVVMVDESVIYFGRGKVALGLDIYVALKAGDQFGSQVPIEGPVNTPENGEQPSFISEDGCRLYFFRTIDVTSTIHVATRTPQ